MNIKLLSIVFGVVVVLGLSVLAIQTKTPGIQNAYPDLIQIDSPSANAAVVSPLTVTGKARGTWYFEASFPVKLFDANNVELAVAPAQAQSDWMTENFVPFKATLTFAPSSTKTGTLVLENDNPSGDPTKSKEVRIPVQFPTQEIASSATFEKSITIGLNNTITFPDGLSLSLQTIDDSRCQKDMVCIWAGELSATLAATGGTFGTSGETIQLGTVRNRSVNLGGYTVSLQSATEQSVTITVTRAVVSGGVSGINGYIHMGPICPVEKYPPDPNCADRPYVDAPVSIRVKVSDASVNVAKSDANGRFQIQVPMGIYTVTVGTQTNNMFPECNEETAIVQANTFANVDISCDTGIR